MKSKDISSFMLASRVQIAAARKAGQTDVVKALEAMLDRFTDMLVAK